MYYTVQIIVITAIVSVLSSCDEFQSSDVSHKEELTIKSEGKSSDQDEESKEQHRTIQFSKEQSPVEKEQIKFKLLNDWTEPTTQFPQHKSFSASELYSEITFYLDGDSKVSLAVYNQDGVLVREIIRGIYLVGGTHRYVWDGLDQEGGAVPDGTYQWRLVRSNGFQSKYVMTLGTSFQEQSWMHWVGDHGGPGSLAVDDTGIYIGSVEGENQYMMLKLNPEANERIWNKQQYYQFNGNSRRIASNGKHLFQLQSRINRIDDHPYLRRLTLGGAHQTRWDMKWNRVSPFDMDAHGNEIVVSYPTLNGIRWINPENGNISAVRNDLPNSGSVALGGNNKNPWLLFSTANQGIFKLNHRDGQPEKVINVRDVIDIDINHKNGLIAVALENNEYAKVNIYDNKFNLIDTVGNQKRPFGKYNPDLFRSITSIALDNKDNLLLTENSIPRRTVQIELSTKKLKVLSYGNRSFYSFGIADPLHPELHWVNYGKTITLIQLDLNTYTWTPVAVWDYRSIASGLMGRVGRGWCVWEPIYIDDKLYLRANHSPAVIEVDLDSWTITARSWMSELKGSLDEAPNEWISAVEEQGRKKNDSRWFSWSDTNQDGMLDSDEILFSEEKMKLPGASGTYDDSSNFYKNGYLFRVDETVNTHWPSWHPDHYEHRYSASDHIRLFSIRDKYVDRDNNVYAAVNGTLKYNDQLVRQWPHGPYRRTRLLKWDVDGNLLFSVSSKQNYKSEINTGRLAFPTFVQPGPYSTIWVNDQIFNQGVLFTHDGLFISNLIDQRTNDGLPEMAYRFPGDDYQNAYLFKSQEEDIYYVSAGVGRQRVYKITGWGDVSRMYGYVEIKTHSLELENGGEGLKISKDTDQDIYDLLVSGENELRGMKHKLDKSSFSKSLKGKTIVLEGAITPKFTDQYQFDVSSHHVRKCVLYIGEHHLDLRNMLSEPIYLKSGQNYDVRLEIVVDSADANWDLRWQNTVMDLERIPNNVLSAD